LVPVSLLGLAALLRGPPPPLPPPSCPDAPPNWDTVHCGHELTALRYSAVSGDWHWDELRVYASRRGSADWDLEEDEVQTVLLFHTHSTSSEYITYFVDAAAGRLAARSGDQNVLLLGLGGGSAAYLLRRALGCHLGACALQLTGVDASVDALNITRALVLPEGPSVRYVHSRAEPFLAAAAARSYDVIFADLYVGPAAPRSTRGLAFASRARSALSADGLYVLNWYDAVDAREFFEQHLQMLRSLFGQDNVWYVEVGREGDTDVPNKLVFARA
jgi:spermidine synthase